MSDETKRIPIKEFRELGFIQEINRRLLHPCGLALEVIVDLETGEEKLGGVWDYREDPEGIYYGEGVLSKAKNKSVDDIWYSKTHNRAYSLGYIVQPLTEGSEEVQGGNDQSKKR